MAPLSSLPMRAFWSDDVQTERLFVFFIVSPVMLCFVFALFSYSSRLNLVCKRCEQSDETYSLIREKDEPPQLKAKQEERERLIRFFIIAIRC